MLRQRWYGEQRLVAPGAFPVGQQVGAMDLGPVPDECQRPGLQGSRQDGPVDGDRRAPFGVVGVEVSDRMIPLILVHIDHYTVECAYPWHDVTVAVASGNRRHLAQPSRLL
jgi:hypothetical protein